MAKRAQPDLFMQTGAEFSEDRRYRWALSRIWDADRAPVVWIGLNPSTANEEADDATARRCVGFARRWGYGGVWLLNLFAFCATEPKDMHHADDPVGPENTCAHLRARIRQASAGVVVAHWGVHGDHLGRGLEVAQQLPRLYCLGRTKDDHPKHVLYLPNDAQLEPYNFTEDST